MSHTEGNFKFCINLAVHQGNSSPSTNKRGQGGHFDLHKSTEQVKWVLYLNKIKKKKKIPCWSSHCLHRCKKQTESSWDLSPVTCQPTLTGLRGNYQLCCKSPEQSCIALVVVLTTNSEKFKQIPFLLSRELVRGLQEARFWQKKGWLEALQLHSVLSDVESWKRAPARGAARARLLQRKKKPGNESNPCAALHHLNGSGLVVVRVPFISLRQGYM